MRMIRRGFRWGVHIFIPKVFNLIVIFVLVFQPVGQGGLYSIALAIESDPVAPVEDVVPAPDPVEEEENSTPAETPTDILAEIPAETLAEIPTETLTEEPVETPIETVAETPAETPVETTAIETEDTSASEETTTDTTLLTPAEEDAISTPAAPVDETVCLSASVTGDSDTDWTVDEEKGVAETDGPVQLGVRYVYPLDKEVTVTFTCLPADESKRAPLKIERIDAADITLPDGVVAATEYAYDITTEGMDNGDFKYDLSLPKSDMDGAEVKYIEQSADEVIVDAVAESELKSVNEGDVEEAVDSVTVSDLDHFTTFLVTTYSDATSTLAKSVYTQGETVFVKATNFDVAEYYRLSID